MSDTNPLPSDELDQLFAVSETVPADHLNPVAKEDLEPAAAPRAAQPAAPVAAAKKTPPLRFEDFLIKLTPYIWVVPACLVANIAYFLVMVFQGVNYLQPEVSDLLLWGANYGPLTWRGEPWRLLTSMFMHCGLLHLGINMWALWSAGRMFERLVGSVGFLIIYLVSGIAGGLASAWWNGDVVSAGASGAIFGILGAFASFIWNRADSFPLQALKQLRSNLAMCIGVNVLFGATFPGIDQAAHIGGLLAGFILGLLLSQRLDESTSQRRPRKNLIAGAISVLVLGILIIQHPAPPADLYKELTIYEQIVPQTIAKFELTVEQFVLSKVKGDRPEGTRLAVAEVIEDGRFITVNEGRQLVKLVQNELLPEWEKVTKHLNSLQNVARGHQSLVNRMKTQLALREESWKLMIEAFQQRDRVKLAAFKAKWKQADLIENQILPRQTPQ